MILPSEAESHCNDLAFKSRTLQLVTQSTSRFAYAVDVATNQTAPNITYEDLAKDYRAASEKISKQRELKKDTYFKNLKDKKNQHITTEHIALVATEIYNYNVGDWEGFKKDLQKGLKIVKANCYSQDVRDGCDRVLSVMNRNSFEKWAIETVIGGIREIVRTIKPKTQMEIENPSMDSVLGKLAKSIRDADPNAPSTDKSIEENLIDKLVKDAGISVQKTESKAIV